MAFRKGPKIHAKSLSAQLWQRVRGVDRSLVQAGQGLPPIEAVFPRGRDDYASALSEALNLTLGLAHDYKEVLERLPSLIVVEMRPRNICSCLGHHHEGPNRSTRAHRLSQQIGTEVVEIDLAVEAIRDWEPQPLASLAVSSSQPAVERELGAARFHSGLLSVFLHELEHAAFPSRPERAVRKHSDAFYERLLGGLMAERFGVAYGI